MNSMIDSNLLLNMRKIIIINFLDLSVINKDNTIIYNIIHQVNCNNCDASYVSQTKRQELKNVKTSYYIRFYCLTFI